MYATGAAELRRIAATCKLVASDGQIAKDVTNQTRARGPVIRAAFKAHATAVLPKRGGLNAWVASSRMTFRAVRGGRRGGITVTLSKAGHDLDGLDGGTVIHPDNRSRGGYRPGGRWFEQGVVPESISEPIRNEGGNALEAACLFALEHAAERIARA